MRLLLVEDNIRLAVSMQESLGKSGLQADPVHTAADAIDALKVQSYDLVILDLGLPDRDGLILLKEIRILNKKYTDLNSNGARRLGRPGQRVGWWRR